MVEMRLLLGDTASSLAGKVSLDIFPLVVISTTTITEIHHFLCGEWRVVGVCFSSGVDRKLFILSLFGKPSRQGSPAGSPGRGREKGQWEHLSPGWASDLGQAASSVCSSQKRGEAPSKERGRQTARGGLGSQR